MNSTYRTYLIRVLFVFYLLYIASSTFSIALAQSTLGLAAAVMLLLLLNRQPLTTTSPMRLFYLFAGGYVAWMVLAALLASSWSGAVLALREEWLFVAVPIGVFLFRDDRNARRLIFTFAAAVGIVSLFSITQHFTGWYIMKSHPLPPAPNGGYLVCGNFPHPLTFGNYYATAALFMLGLGALSGTDLARRTRWLVAGAGVLAAGATLLTYSRGSILALLGGLLMLAAMIRRRYLGYAVALIGLGVIAAALISPGSIARVRSNLDREFGSTYENSRMFIWKKSAEIIDDHPVFGVGQGNYHEAYASRMPADSNERKLKGHAHNDLINIAVVGGLPAMLLFVAMWAVLLVSFWRGRRAAPGGRFSNRLQAAALLGSVAFVITSLTEATFADEEVREMLMFIWAVGLAGSYKKEIGLDRKPAELS